MTSSYIIAAIVLKFIAVYLFKEKNSFTSKGLMQLSGGCVFAMSMLLLILAFGTLSGIFVSLALVSLLGMVFPLALKGTH